MAVEAQYPSIVTFSPAFCNRAENNAMEEVYMLQEESNMLGLYGSQHAAGVVVNNGMVFSEPHSELTCNASRQRKRPWEELPVAVALQQSNLPSTSSAAAYGHQQSRLLESGGTSTSGRPASPITQDFVSHLFHQNIEIDTLVRLHMEGLRSGLEEAWKRQCRALLHGVEQRAAERLREKEAELEKARQRNAELEERVRQATSEVQMWFAIAKNNEAVAAGLQASLEEVVLRNAATAQAEEGYGDTEEDAQSCCFADASASGAAAAAGELLRRRRRACRECGAEDACVLLLPCSHLCLCNACVSKADTCPVCRSPRNTCLQIIMS